MQPRKHTKTFTEKVLAVVKTIPSGKVLTYSEVAWKAGNHNAYRAVGNILMKNFDPKIPCHRVVKSDGDIGEYNRGKAEKLRKLRAEGAKVALQGK